MPTPHVNAVTAEFMRELKRACQGVLQLTQNADHYDIALANLNAMVQRYHRDVLNLIARLPSPVPRSARGATPGQTSLPEPR